MNLESESPRERQLDCGTSLDTRPMEGAVGKFTDPDRAVVAGPPPGTQYAPPEPAAPQSAPGQSATGKTTDELLLDRYRHGDRASFSQLVERYHRELFHFLVRFLGDRTAAEDIFQETFLQVHQSAAQFDISRRFRPWLFTIAANKARDLRRTKARRPSSSLQTPITPEDEQGQGFIDFMTHEVELPGETLERDELARRVRATVHDMPEPLRQILMLSYFEQFPYRQISEILNIPLGTVKSRLHTAVADFAIRWKDLNKSQRTS